MMPQDFATATSLDCIWCSCYEVIWQRLGGQRLAWLVSDATPDLPLIKWRIETRHPKQYESNNSVSIIFNTLDNHLLHIWCSKIQEADVRSHKTTSRGFILLVEVSSHQPSIMEGFILTSTWERWMDGWRGGCTCSYGSDALYPPPEDPHGLRNSPARQPFAMELSPCGFISWRVIGSLGSCLCLIKDLQKVFDQL